MKLCFIKIGEQFRVNNQINDEVYELVSMRNAMPFKHYEHISFKINGWYSFKAWLHDLRVRSTRTGTFYYITSGYGNIPFNLSLQVTRIEQPKKEKSTMEKNLAALIRDDAKTIKVQFGQTGKVYTYVTHLDVKIGDHVVVPTSDENRYSVAEVKAIDDKCNIDQGSDLEYKWVIHAFNLEDHLLNEARNRQIEELVADATRASMRRTFLENILAGVEPEKRKEIEAVVSSKPTGAKRLRK